MKFHLLDHAGAPSPRFSFEATGPKAFRSAIAGLAPHDTGPAMQLRQLNGLARLAAEIPRPGLMLIDDD